MQIFIHCKTSFAVNKYLHTVAFVGFLFTLWYSSLVYVGNPKFVPVEDYGIVYATRIE